MSRRGENIYKRKDGRWEGRYKKGRKANGKLKYGYVYGRQYKEVKEKLNYYNAYYKDLIYSKGECAISYEEWTMSWLNKRQYQLKQSTHSSYFYKLSHYIFPYIGTLSLNELTPDIIQNMITQWNEKGLKPSIVHVLYHILKKSLTDAFDQNFLTQQPCKGIYLPKKQNKVPRALSKIEQEKLESLAKSSPLHQGLPVLLALNAGLRIGEISALRWDDIDMREKKIYVRKTVQRIQHFGEDNRKTTVLTGTPKTNKGIRIIPMSFTLYKYLKKWKKKSPSIYVCSIRNKPTEPRLINYYFARLRSKAQLTKAYFHCLRHTFATRCIESSSSIASISHLLGHASSKTTLDVYTESFIEERQRVINQMEYAK